MADGRAGKPSQDQSWTFRDILAEARSHARFFAACTLPRLLAWPFRSNWGIAGYIILMLAFVFGFLPSATQPVAGGLILDLLKKIGLENTAPTLYNLFAALPAFWRFLLPILLLVWGVITRLWAWDQDQFFRALEGSPVRVIRGPGRRWDFLLRLKDSGAQALGVGPSGRMLSLYVPRDEDPHLRTRMKQYAINRHDCYGVLITAKPTTGKTRTALQLIAELDLAFVLAWKNSEVAAPIAGLKQWRGRGLLFLDNLRRAGTPGGPPLPEPVIRLLDDCPHLILVGTVRHKEISSSAPMVDVVELSAINPEKLEDLAKVVAAAEQAKGLAITPEQVLARYNGHPGGLVAGVAEMKKIYDDLDSAHRVPLRAAKLLWEMGIRNLKLDRLREVAELIRGEKYLPGVLEDELDILSRQGFLSLEPE